MSKITIGNIVEFVMSMHDEESFDITKVSNKLSDDRYDNANDGCSIPLINLPDNISKIITPHANQLFRIGVGSGSIYDIMKFYELELKREPKDALVDFVGKNEPMISKVCPRDKILKMIKNDDINRIVLYVISEMLKVSIMIFGIEDDMLYCIYCDDEYNPDKNTIMIAYVNGIFEPIVYGDKKTVKIMTYSNCKPLQKFIDVEHKNIRAMLVGKDDNKVFKVAEIEKDGVDTETCNYEEIPEESKELPDKTPENKETIKYDTKMKVSELQEIAIKHNIEITKTGSTGKPKNKTKAELCKEFDEFNSK